MVISSTLVGDPDDFTELRILDMAIKSGEEIF